MLLLQYFPFCFSVHVMKNRNLNCADYKGAERYSFILRPCSGYNS